MSADPNVMTHGLDNLDLIKRAQSPTPKPAQIPGDVLVGIFLKLASNTSMKTTEDRWDWVSVMEVCSYWRAVASETPELWSYLSPGTFCSAKQIERFLQMSKDSDLTVYFDSNRGQFSKLKMALKELQRIRHLEIHLSTYRKGEGAELRALLGQPAPRAESIKLHMIGTSRGIRVALPITLPGVLQRVELDGLSSNMSCLSGLKSLHINYCYKISLSDLLQTLEASPSLSFLFVSSNFFSPSSSTILKSVHLPHLIHLHLKMKPFQDLYNLLSNIEVPNLLGWRIEHSEKLSIDDVAKLNVLMKLMEREYDYNKALFTLCSGYGMRTSEPFLLLIIHNKHSAANVSRNTCRALELSFADLNVTLLHIAKLFDFYFARLEHLSVHDYGASLTVESWHTFFRHFICLHVAEIQVRLGPAYEDITDNGLNHLKAFTLFRSEEAPEIQVLCPALNEMVIKVINSYTGDTSLDQFHSVLEEILRTRSLQGSAVRVLTITIGSEFTPLNDEKLGALSQWVQEFNWTHETE